MKYLYYLILTINSFCYAQKPEIVVQMGHSNYIKTICFSPDGKYIASGSFDHLIKLWDIQTGKEVRTFFGHNGVIESLSFSPDGNYLLSSSNMWDGSIKLWNVESGENISTYIDKNDENKRKTKIEINGEEFNLEGYKDGINSVVFSQDGLFFASGSDDGIIKLWKINQQEEIKKIKGHDNKINTLAYSPDGKFIASGSDDGIIKLWDVNSFTNIRTILTGIDYLNSICFTTDGKYIGCSVNYDIKLWDIQNENKYKVFSGDSVWGWSICVSPDGKYIAGETGNNDIVIWNLINDFKQYVIKTNTQHHIVTMAFSPNSKYLINAGMDTSIMLWDIEKQIKIKTFKNNTGYSKKVVLSPDNKFFASAGEDYTVKLWEIESGKIIRIFNGHEDGVNSVAFSPDGKFIASTGWDKTVILWDLQTGEKIKKFLGFKHYLETVTFSSNGRFLAVGGGDKVIYILDINSKDVYTYEGHKFEINSIKFSPKFNVMASCSNDSTIKIWDLNIGKCIKTIKGHKSQILTISFSPDGKYLASGGNDNIIKMWNIQTGSLFKKFIDNTGWIETVEFSKDGFNLLSAGDDNKIKLWEINTGKIIKTFEGHKGIIYSAVMSENKKTIISSSIDNSIKIWDVDNSNILANLFSVNRLEWLAITPDNNYSCSRGGINAIAFRIGNHAYPPEQFDLQFNRPDIVLERIGYASQELIDAYHEAYLKRLKKMNFKEEMFREDFHLPEIEITNKDNIEFTTDNNNLTLNIKASDDKYTLDRLNIYVNEVPVYGTNGINLRDSNTSDDKREINLELSEGENRIQVSVLNSSGVESLKDEVNITCNKPKTTNKTYYIGIGVSNYQDNNLNLKFAEKDVNDLAKVFSSKPNTEIILLTNEQVTRENILALKEKLIQTNVDDEVIISISGHGFLSNNYDFYFATYNINPKEPEINGISYDEIENLLNGIPARKKLLLIDACHSGEVDKENIAVVEGDIPKDNKGQQLVVTNTDSKLGLTNSFDLMQELFANLSRGSGAVVISASRGYQYAQEGDQWQNGVFTHCIIEGLKDKKADKDNNGEIKVTELKDYVIEQVEKLTNGTQKPTSRRENLEYDWKVW